MLKPEICDLLNVRNVDELRRCVATFAEGLDFRTMSLFTVLDQVEGPPEFMRVHNIPDVGWASIDPRFGARDPVMQHLRRRSEPIVWGPHAYTDPVARKGYEIVEAMGLCSGMSVASHFPDGRHFTLSVHVDRVQPPGRHAGDVVKRLEHYAVYALDTAFRLLMPTEHRNVGELTTAEIGALRYAFDGWSDAMLAARFGLSEPRCRQWLAGIAVKLDCRAFRQAALKARRIGIFR